MLNDKLDSMIIESRKSNDSDKLRVLQAIKSEFSKVIHSKQILDEAKELKILTKMHKERVESAKIYEENGRKDLVKIENTEARELNQFLPERINESVIITFTEDYIKSLNRNISMKDSGLIIKTVKNKYPSAEGKLVSNIIKQFVNNGNK